MSEFIVDTKNYTLMSERSKITTRRQRIVRCKDCIYLNKTLSKPYCELFFKSGKGVFDMLIPKKTDFCSWGEER